jgi:hypothetical protein
MPSDDNRQKRRTKGANEHQQSDRRGIHKWPLATLGSRSANRIGLLAATGTAMTTTPSVDLIRFLIRALEMCKRKMISERTKAWLKPIFKNRR